MATVLSPPEQRVVLDNISWELYEELLAAHQDCSAPRFTYDRGLLEIMSPSAEHENIKHLLALLVEVLAEEMSVNVEGFGSTTFRREDLARGFEPDACFYVQNVERVKGKTMLDLAVDPPPDVIIEIDITSPSLNKFPIYAQMAVPEVWRHDGKRLAIFVLEGEEYTEREESAALRGVTGAGVSRLLEEGRSVERLVWLRRVREWVRQNG